MNDAATVEAVIALYRDDKSYTQIAVLLGLRSRNTAAGIINRARAKGVELPDRRSAISDEARAKRIQSAQKRKRPEPKIKPPTPEPPMAVPAVLVPAEGGSLAILSLTSGTCAWPLGDPHDAAFRYCCAPCAGTYCAQHTKLAYQPRVPRRKRANYVRPIPAFR